MIHGAERLVHEDDLWVHHQRSGDARPLPHTAGQLSRVFALKTVQVHQMNVFFQPFLLLCLGYLRDIHAKSDIFLHRFPRIQRRILEHHTDVTAGPGHRFVIQQHLAAAFFQQSCHNFQHGALAAAGGAHNAHKLTVFDVQINVIQRRYRLSVLSVILFGQIANRYRRHPAYLLSVRSDAYFSAGSVSPSVSAAFSANSLV